MSKTSSKEIYEHYAKVALNNLEKYKYETFKECKNEDEFQDYMINCYIAYYGLRCTCSDGMDWGFNSARGHYHSCDLWKFCHIMSRCLEWKK